MRRLGLAQRIRTILPETLALPAIGQGILAVEYRRDRDDLAAMLRPFEHGDTALAALAERALGLIVEGSCEVPLGAFARVHGDELVLEAFVGMPDGTRLVRERAHGAGADAQRLGAALGERLLASGGREILRSLERIKA